MVDLTSKSISIAYLNPKSPLYPSIQSHILKDIKQLIRVQVILIIVSFVVSSLIAIAMIHGLYLTSSDNSSNIHDLLNRLHGRVKGPMITRLYVKLMSLGCFFLLLLPPVVIILYHGSMIYIALGVILATLGLTLYLYLSLVWSVSVVISVIEDGSYGLEAILKAGDVIKGRRWQGVKLVMLKVLIFSVVYGVLKVLVSTSVVSQLSIVFVYVFVGVSDGLFAWAVSLVFYCDCKRSKDGEGMGIVEGGFIHAEIP